MNILILYITHIFPLQIETKQDGHQTPMNMTVLLLSNIELFPDTETVTANNTQDLFNAGQKNKKIVNSYITEISITSAEPVEGFELNLFMKPILEVVRF